MKQSAILFLLLLVSSPALGQAKDMLSMRGNKKLISGEITGVSPDTISLKTSGRTEKIAVSEVDRLMFYDDPSGLASVRADFKNGQLEQALRGLKSVTPEGREFVRQEIEFLRAVVVAKLALRGEGDINTSARQVGAFLRQHKNSFRFYDACEVMGDLAMSLGRPQDASKYYAKLTESQGDGIRARGSLLMGDALWGSGAAERARQMYLQCEKAKDNRIQAMGKLGVARCDANADSGQAIKAIEAIIAGNDSNDAELFARAYNALGYAFTQAGQPEAALDAFLHTDLLFYRDANNHAEALYYLAELWAEINQPAEATKARQILKQRYKSSMWAQR